MFFWYFLLGFLLFLYFKKFLKSLPAFRCRFVKSSLFWAFQEAALGNYFNFQNELDLEKYAADPALKMKVGWSLITSWLSPMFAIVALILFIVTCLKAKNADDQASRNSKQKSKTKSLQSKSLASTQKLESSRRSSERRTQKTNDSDAATDSNTKKTIKK